MLPLLPCPQATRYNYTSAEKCAITEVVAMIKGVQHLVMQLEDDMRGSICKHLYNQLQDLVQVQLREPLRKATKNKKEVVKGSVLHTQAYCFLFLTSWQV